MSVEVLELKDSLSAQIQISDDLKTSVNAVRKFIINSDTPISEATALTYGPAIGSQHPNLAGVYCVSKQTSPVRKDLRSWVLVCNYKNIEAQGYNENPLQRPPQISWSTMSYEEDFVRDIVGRAVLNSAGDYFDPPAKVQRSRWQVNYVRNVAFIPFWVLNYSDSINSDQFLLDGVPILRNCAFLESIQISPYKVENNVGYRELTLSFVLQGYSWQPMILDQGLYERDINGNRKRIRINGEPVTEPVLLDGYGGVLANPRPENAVFLPFKAYKELPFSAIL